MPALSDTIRDVGKVYEAIDGRLREFLLAQHVFFVATAPSGVDGHVNVSPKGMTGAFAVLGPQRVAYLDYTGSGAETIAHLRDNGRITLMFCAFDGPPTIVRLHGRGEVVLPEDSRFAALREAFPPRDLLERWAARKSGADLDTYRAERNASSIDGLPALAG